MQRLLALRTGCMLAALLLGSGKERLRAADASAEGIEFFEKKIRPLLADNCFKCHGNGKKKGNLQLDSRAGLLRGGDSGPAIVAGQPEQSLLIKAIRYQDDNLRMPPRSKLADQHIADFAAWIKMGAPWPEKIAAHTAGPGDEFDYEIPEAYRYRDYVIRAFNDDIPYDQFVVEHIAGDLLPAPRRHAVEHFNESILGTGFWFLGEMVHSPVDVRADEAERIDNQIDVLGKAFLGVTLVRPRGHDHKVD